MKKIFLTMAALSAIAAAAPAAAQYSRAYDYRSQSIEDRLDRLRVRLDAGVRRGTITRSEAIRLQDQLRRLDRLEDQYDGNGFSSWERTDLERRALALEGQLRAAEGAYGGGSYGRDQAYPGGTYGRDYDGDGDWDDGRYDDDRDGNGWDDRGGYDSDGVWDDDYVADGTRDYDRDNDRWDDRPFDPIDDDYDSGDRSDDWDADRWNDGGPGGFGAAVHLRVGARAPGNLGAVPPEFRSRYRDGNGVYYRYDDGRVYQIDSRTNVIRWIGNLPY